MKGKLNMKYSYFIGRYQPLHKGHIKLIKTVLKEGKKVLIALRETGVNKENPYSTSERRKMFWKAFENEMMDGTIKVIEIPDIEEICWGRGVGWGRREIRLDKQTEAISATKLRKRETKKI